MCPDAVIGETGVVNGITYTKRTKEQITTANAATTCTSGITDMSNLFTGATTFNEDISSWDTSNVTDMSWMFNLANSFNQPLSNWDVSNVSNMNIMFNGASSFNQHLNNWDVSSVTSMNELFKDAISFNQPLNNWNVSNVVTMAMMFSNSESFNQSLNSWNVSNVVNMSNMFNSAKIFNEPLHLWDVSNVDNMTGMFSGANSFNQDISGWNYNSSVDLTSFLSSSGLSRLYYDSLLGAFYNLGLQNKTLGSSYLAYCDENTRESLISSQGWTITGDYFFSACALTQGNPFITTWEVTEDDLRIDIPTTGSGYNYAIDFGDGNILTNLSGDATHTYATPGVYNVKIAGYFPRIYFNNSGDKNKIISIEQWGDIQWQSMQSAFSGCNKLVINATDSPNLSQVTDMSQMFYLARSLNQNINHWDVSNVSNMEAIFSYANEFNQPLNNWNVSNVINMIAMFKGALAFNQNINSWNVSNVNNMAAMFSDTNEFNQPLDNWDVSNVTTFYQMFQKSRVFNQPLNNWNTTNVTSINSMFKFADTFNQPINNWNVTSVTNFNSAFLSATNFNQNLSDWDFNEAANFQGFISYTDLDIQNYENLLEKFEQLAFENKSLGADGLLYCFAESRNELASNLGWFIEGDAHLVNCNSTIPAGAFVTLWKVSSADPNITIRTFGTGYNYTVDFGDGSIITNVTGNITHTYTEPGAYFVSITGDFPRIYFNNSIVDIHKILSVEQWGNIEWQSMERAFLGCSNLKINATDAPDLSQVLSMANMFGFCTFLNQDINHWDVSNVTNMKQLFQSVSYFNKPLNNWDVSSVTDMSFMFSGATFFNQSLNNWDVSNVINMEKMFSSGGYDKSLTNWDVSNVINMNGMFSFTEYNMPLANWDVSSVNNMGRMFERNSLFNQSIDNWNVSNVLTMSHMFNGAESFNQPLNNWDVSNVVDMSFMFSRGLTSLEYVFNQSLNNWDVSSVLDMSNMFSLSISYNKDISEWSFNPLVNLSNFIGSSGFDPINYEALLNRFVQLGYENKILGAGSVKYCDNSSRNELVNNMGWTISDGGLYDNCGLYSNNPFITTWFVSGSGGQAYPLQNLSLTIPTVNSGYSYEIDFGDGTVESFVNGNISHTYSQPGTYTVKISGKLPRLFFYNSSSTNRSKIVSIDNWGDIKWTSFDRAFYECENLIINANDAPNLNQVTSMNEMFKGAQSVNQPIEHWDISNVLFFSEMFEGASNFNQPLNNWDVSNAITIRSMFKNASSFNKPLNNWDISDIQYISEIFEGATSFNQDLSDWDVSNATHLENLFYNAVNFDQDLSNWNFNPSVNFSNGSPNAEAGFIGNTGLSISNYDALLERFVELGLENKNFGAASLEYCNIADHNYLVNTLGWTINGDNLSTACSSILGVVIYDVNNDGCDPNDLGVNGFMVNAYNTTTNYSTFSYNGAYDLSVFGDSFTVSLTNVPDYFTVTPESATVIFSGSNTEEQDFCLTANQSINDLNITLLTLEEARPGFEADYQLVVRNVGTETINNVSATLNFDDAMQSFTSASPEPNSTTASSLTFELGTLQPFESSYVDVTMQTFPPPTVEGDDILNFTATVTPETGDFTPDDNTYELEQIVVNSFDPNDKQVMQGAEVHIDDIDEYLDYRIRFQNTGTASAINVRILDTLHPKLDWNTLIPISASHDYIVQITNGNQVEFLFDYINLPHEAANEPESHGFVAYKIKPKSNVQVGDIISGDAGIYFDFNPPIITNMVFTEIVENLQVSDIPNPLNAIFIYPNPSDKTLQIQLTAGIELEKVIIYDLQGREVEKITGNRTTIDVENLSRGMYLLKIQTNQGTINRQLIKN